MSFLCEQIEIQASFSVTNFKGGNLTNVSARMQKKNIEFLIMSFPKKLFISTSKSAKIQMQM